MSTKKKKLLLTITAIVAFVAAIVGGYFYQMMTTGNEKSDSSITEIEPSDNDESKGDANVSLQYAGYATLFSDEKLITLNFTNPSKSKKSLSLEIVANVGGEDIVLATTDKIRPGNKIDKVDYKLDREISRGNYKGKFIVHFYNDQDKEEIVNSEIKINIYVK